MHPTLVEIGGFTITTYGVIVATAALAGTHVFGRGLEIRGLDREIAWTLLGWALAGALVGAKLYYVGLHGDLGALLSRGGLVWYGGLIGGLTAGAYAARRHGLALGPTADAAAPARALGHGIGHVGCFFSGDSYGLPSDLPWAVAFPRGMPPSTAGNLRRIFGADVPASVPDGQVLAVHPTMLYSAVGLLAVFAILWALRRTGRPAGWLFGLYLLLSGVERFAVEFLRAKDDRFLWGLTTAQGIAAVAIVAGVALLAARRTSTARSARDPSAAGSTVKSA